MAAFFFLCRGKEHVSPQACGGLAKTESALWVPAN